MTIAWPQWRALPLSPPCAPLAPLIESLPAGRWPSADDWSGLAAAHSVTNARGIGIAFVPPSAPPPSAMAFEKRVFDMGEVETRPGCWHDAFHAAAWLMFPRAKSRINALHVADGLDDTPNRRGVLRNVLTLIDEGGLLVASADATLLKSVRAFQWHELFWRRRGEVNEAMDFTIFGHALYERALGMPHGITGRGVLLEVDTAYFRRARGARMRYLDARLCDVLDDRALMTSPGFIQPVPIKGIPGWADENRDEAYYFDTSQFCTGRRPAVAC